MVTISELNADLTPTGRVFFTQIASDDGRFALAGVGLVSPIVELRVDGYYYNEVQGVKSVAPIALYALANVDSTSTLNVNLLTTVERKRVQMLMASGTELGAAKRQAQAELFNAFKLRINSTTPSERLSLEGGTDADAAMLAATLILTGYRSNAELTEMLAIVGADFESQLQRFIDSSGYLLTGNPVSFPAVGTHIKPNPCIRNNHPQVAPLYETNPVGVIYLERNRC